MCIERTNIFVYMGAYINLTKRKNKEKLASLYNAGAIVYTMLTLGILI